MWASIILAVFLLSVPYPFKKAGIQLSIDGKSSGKFAFLFSKILWWAGFAGLAHLWVPAVWWGSVLWAIAFLFALELFKDRKYAFGKGHAKKK